MPASPPDQAASADLRPSPAVAHAAAILRHLGRIETAEGVTAIARATGLSPSSAFAILKTLSSEGLARFDPATKRYALGPAALELAARALGRDPLLRRAQPVMERLAQTHDAAVGLWRQVDGDRLMLLALAESGGATRIHMAVGQRQPLAAGAAGRALLAMTNPPADRVRAGFDAVRWQSPIDFETYLAGIEDARRLGHATDRDHAFRGITTIATAFAPPGQPVHVLSASTFTGQKDEAAQSALGAAIAAEARALSALPA